ncbi:MAG: hypothetical protein HYR56_10475 [Acidobacteria bacterium]|nr:hypothetical protein [Acidobacteriota bacterium]MBI3425698.1 hypothetical protein [Acidobacteriota bacterium]
MVAKSSTVSSSIPTVSETEVREVLARILQSKHFSHAPKKQKFLLLICDYYVLGRAGELNEYLIGREVFDRTESYNPAADPIVRVGAHDIRKKLDLYYQEDGISDAVRLIVPIGSYEPAFVRNFPQPVAQTVVVESLDSSPTDSASKITQLAEAAESPKTEPALSNVTPEGSSPRRWSLSLAVLSTLSVVVIAGLLWVNWKLQQQLEKAAHFQQAQSNGGLVWVPFLKNGTTPTLLILSNPSVYRSAHAADPSVIADKGVTLTPAQARELTDVTGSRLPLLADQVVRLIPAPNMYTGIGEAIGAYRLTGFLQGMNEKTLLKQSRNIGPEDLKQYDTILLGSVYANQWSKPLSIKENFVFTARATIQNLAPRPGEEREYRAAFDQRNGILLEDYALISVTPGVSDERTIMVLAGMYSEGTQAACEFVTTAGTLAELNRQLQQAREKDGEPPHYYQALLKVSVENAFPTKATLVAIRELQVINQ